MNAKDLLEKLAPPHDIGITIRDARAVRKILQRDLDGALRIPRGDIHRTELVAAYRHYDGGLTDGEGKGYYANVFIAWRMGTATWRSGGVRILPFEAERIARAIERYSNSRPARNEPERISGGAKGTTSALCTKTLDDDTVLVFVKFEGQGGHKFRSRGVEIRAGERVQVVEGLRSFAKMRGSNMLPKDTEL